MFKRGARVVFAFSDTAGANACLAQAFIIHKEIKCNVACLSNKPIASTLWATSVQVKQQLTEGDLQHADVLFTGTSHPITSGHFELHAIHVAKAKKIYTIAFVDHWTSIAKRFELNGINVFPDEIWLPDEFAKSIALKEGIPEALIRVHVNPYLIYLSSHWKSAYPEKSYTLKLGLSSKKKLIVIAPDPVSLRIQDFDPGFTETTALHDLLGVISQSEVQDRVLILIKAHPLQPLEAIQPVIDQYSSIDLKLITKSDNPELINIADLVVGFYSNFLVEALAMNKPILRYYPGDPTLDPFRHLSRLSPISNPSQALLSLQAIL